MTIKFTTTIFGTKVGSGDRITDSSGTLDRRWMVLVLSEI